MLVWPSGQRRVSVVPRRGSPGGAATFAPQVALIRAPLTVSKVWLRTGGSSCTVSTRPSRPKRMRRSTSQPTSTTSTFLLGAGSVPTSTTSTFLLGAGSVPTG
jgi:hypothetical protein